jgi:predicted nucleic acid-binding protein
MNAVPALRVVLDTDIVFEGLTRRDGAAGLLVEAWLADLMHVCVSNAIAYEYIDALARKLSGVRWERVKPVLSVLLTKAHFVTVYYRWRPSSPDPADEHVIDCAMNAGVAAVTKNLRHFRAAQESLGLHVLSPVQAVDRLAEQLERREERGQDG